jgi:hypothetical protein
MIHTPYLVRMSTTRLSKDYILSTIRTSLNYSNMQDRFLNAHDWMTPLKRPLGLNDNYCPICKSSVRKWRNNEFKLGTLFHTTFAVCVRVPIRICNNCASEVQYDGIGDGILNLDNDTLFTHELIIEFLEAFTGNGTAQRGWWAEKIKIWIQNGNLENSSHASVGEILRSFYYKKTEVGIIPFYCSFTLY